jgi:LytS/YehU family sensor histidine kinase
MTVFIILLVAGTILVIYIRQTNLKALQKQDELKLESLRGQMNPHFIFNSLNSINYFISKNDKLSANHYIADFARLIRSILTNLSNDYIPLEKELESIQDYLNLEHLRFGDKFNYSLKFDQIKELQAITVFPGMVQPFIENAIWHGVRGLEYRMGLIRIEFSYKEPSVVQCVVEDDGIGRKQSELYKNQFSGKKSQGIGIVLERLKIINGIRNANLQVKIEDLYPDQNESGTKVTIDIPAQSII